MRRGPPRDYPADRVVLYANTFARARLTMPAILALILAAILTPTELPSLAEVNRFPTAEACEAQLGALVRIRHVLRQALPTKERDAAMAYNARQLAAWEALLEARGGLAEEEGNRDSEGARRAALARLRDLLVAKDWKAARMP